MILNHLNLTVTDPAATSAFLAKYFGLSPLGGNLGMQLMGDDSGMVLTLTKARSSDRSKAARTTASARTWPAP